MRLINGNRNFLTGELRRMQVSTDPSITVKEQVLLVWVYRRSTVHDQSG